MALPPIPLGDNVGETTFIVTRSGGEPAPRRREGERGGSQGGVGEGM